MFSPDPESDRNLRTELRKAENRERIAQCKLERLKERFDKLYDDVATSQSALTGFQIECETLRGQLERTEAERDRAAQEALMWRTQLFERMELLENTKLQLVSAEHELEAVRAKVGQASLVHQTSHEELKKRDRERLVFELRIEELQKAEKEAKDQANDLLEALTDAETAISTLQRANDLYEREVDGLKSLGAGLSGQLSRTADQLDLQREKNAILRDELRLERVETDRLRTELLRFQESNIDLKNRLVSVQLEPDSRELRKAGQEKALSATKEKFGEFAATPHESQVQQPSGRDVLSRATKKMSGWFRL